jgi:hypothetical protein
MSPADLFAITGVISLLLATTAVIMTKRDDDNDPRRTA